MSEFHKPGRIVVLTEILPDGTDLPQGLVQDFRLEVMDAVLWLPHGVTCGIANLVKPKFWLPRSRYARSKLGRFLAYWVVHREVPLEFVGSPTRSNKRYRLRQ